MESQRNMLGVVNDSSADCSLLYFSWSDYLVCDMIYFLLNWSDYGASEKHVECDQ